jgi:carboxypeptidase family protein
MLPRTLRLASSVILFLIAMLPAAQTVAAGQEPGAGNVSGTVHDASGKPIAHATLTLKNAGGQQAATAESDATGKYQFPAVKPGEYDVTVSAAGFAGKTIHVIVSATQGLLDVSLAAQAPGAAPSLSDLGFSSEQTQADPKMQAILQRRTEMLRMHQRLGLITTAPMVATLFTGGLAKAKGRNGSTITEPSSASLDTHFALGAVTGALYGATAYFAIEAPRVPGTHKHGAIRMHEALAWIHGPGMVATGVLGIMAWKQENSGEKVHGIASAHGPVAIVTTCAYGTAMVAVSWPIHIKWWEKKQ